MGTKSISAFKAALKRFSVLFVWLLFSCSSDEVSNSEKGDLISVPSQWVINACEVEFEGKKLVLGAAVAQWEQVLGPANRFVNEIYVFDQLGLKLYERSGVITSMVLIYKNHPNYSDEYISAIQDEFMRDSHRRSNQARPGKEYQGTVDVEGGIVKAEMDMDVFNAQRSDKNPDAKHLAKGYLPTLYHLYYHCDPAASKMEYVGQRIEFQQGSRNLVQQFVMGGELRKDNTSVTDEPAE